MQLKALTQYLDAESPSLNHVVEADPDDLGSTLARWIVWWPPSTQALAWPFAAAGIPLGVTVRIIGAAAVLIGALGWARWWASFDLPRALLIAVAILLPWRRYPSNAIFQYSAEVLSFASVPWVLLGTNFLIRRVETGHAPGRVRSLAVGAGAGLLYFVKYSAVFVTGGVAVALAARLWRHRPAWTGVILPAAAGIGIPIVVLSALNRWFGRAVNLVAASPSISVSPQMALYAVSNPALMAADAGALLEFVMTNPDHGVWREPLAVAALGVPGGLTLAWLVSKVQRPAERLAAVILGMTLVLMGLTWMVTNGVNFEARHIAGAATAIVPAAIAVALRHWPAWPRVTRAWLVVAAAGYLVVPWAIYGPASVLTKLRRVGPYTTTATRLYNPLLSETDARAALSAIASACDASPVVWYVPEPLTSLELRGPMIITHADFEDLDRLAALRYRGAVPVCALLPPRFEATGKGAAIRASFVDLRHWRRVPVPAATTDLWVGVP